jgi:hypothetical protein
LISSWRVSPGAKPFGGSQERSCQGGIDIRAGMHGSGSELANASGNTTRSATAAAAIVLQGTSPAKAEALFDLRAEAAIVRNERERPAKHRDAGWEPRA